VGHFYFGDRPQSWVNFQSALTKEHGRDSPGLSFAVRDLKFIPLGIQIATHEARQ
jgi:plasmid maintenance system antidote protein VapI